MWALWYAKYRILLWVFWCLLQVVIPPVFMSSRYCHWCVWFDLTSQHTSAHTHFSGGAQPRTWHFTGFRIRKVNLLRFYSWEIFGETTCPVVHRWNGFRHAVLGKLSYLVESLFLFLILFCYLYVDFFLVFCYVCYFYLLWQLEKLLCSGCKQVKCTCGVGHSPSHLHSSLQWWSNLFVVA